MPNVTLIRSHLFEAIGRTYTDKEFDELCFEFGVEVDDVETQLIEVNTCFKRSYAMLILVRCSNCYCYCIFITFTKWQFTADGSKEEHVVYVIAIPANRYDLLCMEGFSRALRIFLDIEKQPVSSTQCVERRSTHTHEYIWDRIFWSSLSFPVLFLGL